MLILKTFYRNKVHHIQNIDKRINASKIRFGAQETAIEELLHARPPLELSCTCQTIERPLQPATIEQVADPFRSSTSRHYLRFPEEA
jgi:hypothetical protein